MATVNFQMWIARKKTLMGKSKNLTVRLKDQMLKAASALQSLLIKSQPEQPHP